MSELTTLARPYARALFELARTGNTFDLWSRNLRTMAQFIQDPVLRRALENPALSRTDAAELFIKACGVQIDEPAKNLVRVLVANDRLPLLPHVVRLFEALRSDAEGLVEAEIITAMDIEPAQKDAIAAALKRRLGRDVKLSTRIDPSLLAGAIVRAGDLVIDGSVKGRLEKMTSALNR